MTARTTMANLIATLRGMCNAGTADYTVSSTAFWSDDQLQTALDRYAVQLRDEPLKSFKFNNAGTVTWLDYQSSHRFFETTDGGTARFVVKDSLGNVQGTAGWSADYERGMVSFTANQGGTAYYLTGIFFDVYAAAADVWYQKAAHASEQIDFSTDNHSIKRSHVANMAFKMARKYEDMATTIVFGNVSIARGDMNVTQPVHR